jgi:hypothetical protein
MNIMVLRRDGDDSLLVLRWKSWLLIPSRLLLLPVLPVEVVKVVEQGGELITCAEGVKQLAKIIYTLHDETKDKPFELEMSWLCKDSDWKHVGVPKDMIKEATEWAKKEIEEAEEESDEDDDDEMEE